MTAIMNNTTKRVSDGNPQPQPLIKTRQRFTCINIWGNKSWLRMHQTIGEYMNKGKKIMVYDVNNEFDNTGTRAPKHTHNPPQK